MRCQKDGCDGEIAEDGYCDTCFLKPRTDRGRQPTTNRPASQPAAQPAGASTTPTGPTTGPATGPATGPTSPSGFSARTGSVGTGRSSSRTRRGNLGAGMVDVPPVPYRDPASLLLPAEKRELPESRRFCGNPKCGLPVGQAKGDRPGLTEGTCPKCGHAYSFKPKLVAGDLVGEQYEVVGCLARGGVGWIYLAQDRALDGKPRVLKGLLDSGDASAMAAAIAERRFLIEVEHPNIVDIVNFKQHGESSYIVMEYVGGQSLKDLRQSGLEGQWPSGPIPLQVAIAYILDILPAFTYLHERGLLFCDFKPDNVMTYEKQVKLIDLGAVCRMDDQTSDLWGTTGYQAPEVPVSGPSVSSDLYTVARSLAWLSFEFHGYQDPRRHATSLPLPAEVAIFQKYPAFYWFLARATDLDPAARFSSADEMADELTGVLRQVRAIDGETPDPAPSQLFTPEVLLDAERPDWRNLPLPNVDPLDPGATLLASLATLALSQPDQVMATLETAEESPEVIFRRVRAHLEAGDLDHAADLLARADATDWRTLWWRGIERLAAGDPAAASAPFTAVFQRLPGELAPQLAWAVAAESAGDSDEAAAATYDLVTRVDPGYAGAAFGLSRTRRRAGDREGAAEALTRIPSNSIWSTPGEVLRCQVLFDPQRGQPPGRDDLVAASGVFGQLRADASVRASVRRQLLEAALQLLAREPDAADPAVEVAGAPLEARELRTALEQTYRSMAKLAPTAPERVALIDRANEARPRTLV
jgi:serine/threonine-protein kinase PknG